MENYDITDFAAAAETAREAFIALCDEINDLEDVARNDVSGAYDFTGLTSETLEGTGAILAKIENTISAMKSKIVMLKTIYKGMLATTIEEEPAAGSGT